MDDQYMTVKNMVDCPFLHNITAFTLEKWSFTGYMMSQKC